MDFFLNFFLQVVSLNTLFILVFAFCPYHIGHFTIAGFKLKSYISGAHFEGMLTTLCGYCIIGICLVILHSFTKLLRFRKFSRIFGLCYVVVKVALLLVIEIVAFPVICGWWLDICSLALFDATLKDRQASYHQSPMASIFMVSCISFSIIYQVSTQMKNIFFYFLALASWYGLRFLFCLLCNLTEGSVKARSFVVFT